MDSCRLLECMSGDLWPIARRMTRGAGGFPVDYEMRSLHVLIIVYNARQSQVFTRSLPYSNLAAESVHNNLNLNLTGSDCNCFCLQNIAREKHTLVSTRTLS
jgi:hypothetical protein